MGVKSTNGFEIVGAQDSRRFGIVRRGRDSRSFDTVGVGDSTRFEIVEVGDSEI